MLDKRREMMQDWVTTLTTKVRLKMTEETKVVNSTPTCGCGKSLHMPYCDGSHGRSEEQYAEWKRQTELEKKSSDTIK